MEARAIIQSAVTFPIRGNRNPRDCWIYLQNRFAPNTPVRRCAFMSRLWSLRIKEGEKVEIFFSKFKELLWELEDMGVVMDEEMLVARLMLALPKSWNIEATMWRQEADKLTRDVFKNDTRRHNERDKSLGTLSIARGQSASSNDDAIGAWRRQRRNSSGR